VLSQSCPWGDEGEPLSISFARLRLSTTVVETFLCCVYFLKGEAEPSHFYTGFTEDLDGRLKHHSSGGDPHMAKYSPWRIKTAIASTDRERVLGFERYFKSPLTSGRAFARKRL